MGYYAYYYMLFPAIIFTFYAQFRIKSAYAKYSRVMNSRGITGAQAASMILRANGLSDIPIQVIGGSLTDNYNPQANVLNLSQGVYGGNSIAAIGVAAHECGHAIQDAERYPLLSFRNNFVPVANIGSTLSWPLLVIGLAIGSYTGDFLFKIGTLLFLAVVVFHLVTLPVELNASKRALASLSELGIADSDSDLRGAKAVLSAAALTYVAALATAVANLLRILAMRRDSR